MLDGGEIDVAAPAQPLPVGDDVAVDAQPRDAAVGKDPQPQVRRRRRAVDRDEIVRVAVERRARQDLGPRRARAIHPSAGCPVGSSQTSIAHDSG